MAIKRKLSSSQAKAQLKAIKTLEKTMGAEGLKKELLLAKKTLGAAATRGSASGKWGFNHANLPIGRGQVTRSSPR